jgi:hypothetical protein
MAGDFDVRGAGRGGADWLVALDDGFTARLRSCTVCGRSEESLWFDIWYERGVVTVAVVVCGGCRGQGELMRERLGQLLRQRYGGCGTA